MNLKLLLWVVTISVFVFTSGCSSSVVESVAIPTSVPTQTEQSLATATMTMTTTTSPASTPLSVISTSTLAKPLTPSVTPGPPAESRLSIDCTKFLTDGNQYDMVLTGSMVLIKPIDNKRMAYRLDLESMTERPIDQAPDWESIFWSISLDKKWLAYKKYNDTDKFLIIEDMAGNVALSIIWRDDWTDFRGWISDTVLMFRKAHSSFLFNPFTLEETEIVDHFPDLAGPIGVGADYWGPVKFSPTLDLVVYPREPGNYGLNRIVLWNLKKSSPVADFNSVGDPFGGFPVWTADGEKFMMALRSASSKWAEDHYIRELYIISKLGEATQITNLAAYLPKRADVFSYAWSPTGEKVAFILTYSFEDRNTAYYGLAIANTVSRQTLSLCLAPASTASLWVNTLAWSLDEHGLAIITEYDGQDYLVWLDISMNVAVPLVAGYSEIIGWMQK